MRAGVCCFVLWTFGVFADNAPGTTQADSGDPRVVNVSDAGNDDGSPKVYVDLSKSAKKNAVSFDGMRGLFGLIYSATHYGAGLFDPGQKFTETGHKVIGLHVGLEYLKTFRKGFVVGGSITADLTQRLRKENCPWKDLNDEYDRGRSVVHTSYSVGDNVFTRKLSGQFTKGILCPGASLKCGYPIKSLGSMVFVRLGASMVTAVNYRYDAAFKDNEVPEGMAQQAVVGEVSVKTFLPSLGLGVEKKFNKQWGASLEANISLRRACEQVMDEVTHKIKSKRVDFRVVGLYTLSQSTTSSLLSLIK